MFLAKATLGLILIQSITTGKARWEKLKVAGDITSTVRKQTNAPMVALVAL